MKISSKWVPVDQYGALKVDSAMLRQLAKLERANFGAIVNIWTEGLRNALMAVGLQPPPVGFCVTKMEVRPNEVCVVTECYDDMGELVSRLESCRPRPGRGRPVPRPRRRPHAIARIPWL